MDVSLDFDGLDTLVADLGHAGIKVTRQAAKVMEKGAVQVKNGMRADFTGHAHAPLIPRAIDYTARGLSFEVGVNKTGPQGGLGNILAFGTSKNPAVVDHTAALRRELPSIEAWLADAGAESLG